MNRTLLILLGSTSILTVSKAQIRPNIIYINADDLGVMDVGYNSDRYNTPNLDKLKREGMVFTNAYAAAANSAPSRASVMSGQYTPRHGVYTVDNSDRGIARERKLIPIENTKFLSDDVLTFPAIFKANGYKTIHLGKWHVTEDPTKQGFDINIGGGASGSPYGGYFSSNFRGPMERFNDVYNEGTHSGDIFADQAISFLKEEGKHAPFFMHMAYYLVHTPLQKVPGLVEKYEGVSGINATYASMIEKMDQSIGAILDELKALGLEDNTFVLFSSDNGGISATSSQAPYRSGKGSYFEGGIREPMLVRWPDVVVPGSSCDVPVIGIDFFPTFLEVAGIKMPTEIKLDGVSLVPFLKQKKSFKSRALYWHFPIYLQKYAGEKDDAHDEYFRTRPGSAMRYGKWKLHEYFEDGRLELYDLENDPGERNNLANVELRVTRKLHRMLQKWRRKTNAPIPTVLNPLYKGVVEKDE